MARIGKGPGHFTLALLVGALLALQCLLPSAAFARSKGPAVAFSSTTAQNYVRDKAGVSIVRLVMIYANGTANVHVTCTGPGILVASTNQGSAYQNQVLTDGNLLRAKMSTCGSAGGIVPLNEIQIWANDEYANAAQGHLLGQLICATQQSGFTCKDGPGVPTAVTENVTTIPASGQSAYTLFSFQSSAGQPFLSPDFAFTPLSSNSSSEVALTNGSANRSGQVYPSATVSDKENPQSYLRPEIISPALNPGGVAPITVAASTVEGGTPIISAQGKLVGMFANNGQGATAPLLTPVQVIWSQGDLPAQPPVVASAQACANVAQTAACWNAGIDAFYGAPTLKTAQYTLADSYFSRMAAAQKQTPFQAPAYFDELALHSSSSHGQPPPTTRPVSSGAAASSQLLLIGLGALLIILVLLLVLMTLLVGRLRRHRRELERFAAEQLEAQRQAEAEVQRQRAQQVLAQGRDVACPHCHKPVRVSDALCPHCRFPLSPTASGLNVRLVGNAPAASISEQPTVQFPPAPAATVNGGGETKTRRQRPAQDHHQPARGRSLSLAVGTRSDPGIKRKHKPNEDSLFAIQGARTHNSQPQQFALFVVADGMGGHANGQDASRLAIQTMIDFMLPRVTGNEQMDDEAFLRLMSDGVQHANQAVHLRNLEERADMGTTMTTALVAGSTAYVANVGDSRTYFYRDGQGLSKVTNDHSVVASLVEAGIIQPDDIYTHPKRNQIYRSLGEKQVVEVDTFKVDLQGGDKLLLCTDGLWDMTRDPVIQQIIGKSVSDPNRTSQELIKAALEGGGEDNVSVIVAQFSETGERSGLTGVQLLAKPESVTVPDLPQV
jgi:serine/threonine protein phosphatase PrpC/Na+-transporting methylmalonyl-CoA/oxaloacetate decarboxylase gamma subunit